MKRKRIKKWDTFQYIPLLPSLRNLLANNLILEQIEKCPQRKCCDGLMKDFCDGLRFASHPLFKEDLSALQIIAYYDELEICNPLGSHIKKHKLGIVFYTLGNISPKYRSQLRVINLAVVATIPIIEKYGLNKILEPFINDLNTLSSTGVSVSINGSSQTFKGSLLAFLGDNLASNDIGGFKKSFSFAFRSCRTCLATKDTLSTSFVSEGYKMRDDESHQKQVSMLNGPASEHYSMIYGINKRSCLLDVNGYSLFNGGLPHDAMHDILEGIASRQIKLLILHCTTAGYFTLKDFNEKLINFNYGYSESNRPVPILKHVLQMHDKPLRASASQTLLLIHILPLIIAEQIPEDDNDWLCFLLLRKIADIVFCPTASEGLCSSLKLLISEYLHKYVVLYGSEEFFPKLHFLIHYPNQIMNVGPMVCTWTMRHEAKLNFFKQGSHLINFKNVAFSLANRHQRWMCYEAAGKGILHNPLECGPAKHSTGLSLFKDEMKDIRDSLSLILPEVSPEATIFRPSWVKRDGIHYESNNAYVIVGSDGLDPIFGHLDELLVIGGDIVIFCVSLCRVLYFHSHYHAYVISITPKRSLFSTLYDPKIYHSHRLADQLTYISLLYEFLP